MLVVAQVLRLWSLLTHTHAHVLVNKFSRRDYTIYLHMDKDEQLSTTHVKINDSGKHLTYTRYNNNMRQAHTTHTQNNSNLHKINVPVYTP